MPEQHKLTPLSLRQYSETLRRSLYDAVVQHLWTPDDYREEGRRYASPRLIGQEKIVVSGTPEEERICTSHVERTNWTLRTHLRRFTRLSNGFSRKKENLRAALALYFAYYNFVRMHKTIRMTPAMAAGIARKPWSVSDLMTSAMAA
jgi:hypothetical protein